MRNIIILFICSIANAAAFCQPKISFETINHDFGLINNDTENLTHVFNYVNTGDSLLVITAVKYTCKCTALNWEQPLVPGDTGQVYITLSPDRSEEGFNEQFEVVSNAGGGVTLIYVQGQTVNQIKKSPFYKHKTGAFAIESQYVPFGNIIKGNEVLKEVKWFNESDETVTIDSLSVVSPAHLKITFDDYEIAPHSEGRMVIKLFSKKQNRIGYGVDNVRFNTNEAEEYQIKEFFVVSTLFPNLPKTEKSARAMIESTAINLGTLREGEIGVAELNLTNIGDAPLKILKVDANCDCVRTSHLPESIGIAASLPFSIYFDTKGAMDNQYKQVSVFTNDPVNPVITIDLKAHINE